MKRLWFLLILLLSATVFTLHANEDFQGELKNLKDALTRQETMLRRLQSLSAGQIQRQDLLEQSLPPEDLLDSLYSGLKQLEQELFNINSRLDRLEEFREIQESRDAEKGKDPPITSVLEGVLALQAGQPDLAARHFQPLLESETPDDFKTTLLMALGNEYLVRDYPEQAASFFGTVIQQSRESAYNPQAMYGLGLAFGMMGDKEKQKIVWYELLRNYPDHPLTVKAKSLVSPLSSGVEGASVESKVPVEAE